MMVKFNFIYLIKNNKYDDCEWGLFHDDRSWGVFMGLGFKREGNKLFQKISFMLFTTLAGLGLSQTFSGINTITGMIDQLNTGTKFASSGIVIQNPTTSFTTTLTVTLGAIYTTSDTIDYIYVSR